MPIMTSTGASGLAVSIAPPTSPSLIILMRAPAARISLISLACRGRSRTSTVTSLQQARHSTAQSAGTAQPAAQISIHQLGMPGGLSRTSIVTSLQHSTAQQGTVSSTETTDRLGMQGPVQHQHSHASKAQHNTARHDQQAQKQQQQHHHHAGCQTQASLWQTQAVLCQARNSHSLARPRHTAAPKPHTHTQLHNLKTQQLKAIAPKLTRVCTHVSVVL